MKILFFIFLSFVHLESLDAAEKSNNDQVVRQLLVANNTQKYFEELFLKLNKDKYEAIKDLIITNMAKELKGRPINPLQGALVKAKLEEIQKTLAPSAMWTIVEPALVKLYQDNLTSEELAAILSFYKTPAGVSLLVKTPRITNELTVLGLKVIDQNAEGIKRSMDELLIDFRSQDTR